MKKSLFYYTLKDKLLISNKEYPFKEVSENFASNEKNHIFALNNLPPEKSRRSFCVTSIKNLFIEKEDMNLLRNDKLDYRNIPNWIVQHIENRSLTSINTAYENWMEILESGNNIFKKWNVTVVGLGDVGGTLITGLRLLGEDCISNINIYDINENKIKRWEYECNQIISPNEHDIFPKVLSTNEKNLFNCDMFVFCVSLGIPEAPEAVSDVRLIQLKSNSRIISYYAALARKNNFKGVFAVVSDPVDLLCKCAFMESNTSIDNIYDSKGLLPEQIRGYGLGVMHARACYYANEIKNYSHYLKEGRAFGPHGDGIVIADSIKNYNEYISSYLTEKTLKANLEVRFTGFKPYVAPGLSSGALSLIATIKGNWNYSSTFLGGSFMGCKNRLLPSGVELETYSNMPDMLFYKLEEAYNSFNVQGIKAYESPNN